MSTNVVDGVDELRDSIGDLVDWLEDPADALLEAAQLVAGDVHPPVLTGALAVTVHAETEDRGAVVKAGGADAPYGAIVNARDHFMQAGLEAGTPAAVDVVAGHIKDHVHDLRGA